MKASKFSDAQKAFIIRQGDDGRYHPGSFSLPIRHDRAPIRRSLFSASVRK